MAVKFHIHKTNALGETFVAEVEVPMAASEETMRKMLDPVLRILDDRMFEMNCRVVGVMETVRGLPPELALKVNRVIEMLYGFAPIPPDLQQKLQGQREGSDTFGSKRKREESPFQVIPGGKGQPDGDGGAA